MQDKLDYFMVRTEKDLADLHKKLDVGFDKVESKLDVLWETKKKFEGGYLVLTIIVSTVVSLIAMFLKN
jgi:hypothetical protein